MHAFPKRLTDKLHENIPLDTERGYHVHLNCDHLISRPVVYADRGFGMTYGTRLKSGWNS